MKTELLQLSPAEFCRVTHACTNGAAFASQYFTLADVWQHCPRVDWLAWILSTVDAPQDEKACRLFMVWCARNTPLPDGRTTGALLTEPASLAVLDVATRFANGEATAQELSAAESAAWSAVESAARSAARSAAWSAARSAQTEQFRKIVANPFAK